MKLLVVSKAGHTDVNREIYKHLVNEYNYQITLIVPTFLMFGKQKIDSDKMKDESFELIPLKMSGSNRFSRYKGIFSILKEVSPDIIFSEDDPMTFLAIYLGLWSRVNDKKFVCRTNHNRPLTFKDETKRLGYIKGSISIILKLTLLSISKIFMHHLVTISNEGKEIFKKIGIVNVTKIPLGFNENRFKINEEKRQKVRSKINLEGTVIAYMGRITEAKGISILIESLGQLLEHPWTFLIDSFEIYDDPYKQYIHSLIDRCNIRNRTVFFDANHLEISGYMNASDIIVLPSITTNNFKEEYGRVAPEAMASGCLVVVSDSGTLPELVGEYGWIFKEGSTTELTNILIHLMSLKEQEKFVSKSSSYAHQTLGINRQAFLMDKIFKDLNSNRSYNHT